MAEGGGIGEEDGDKEAAERKKDAEAEGTEACVNLVRRDYAVAVSRQLVTVAQIRCGTEDWEEEEGRYPSLLRSQKATWSWRAVRLVVRFDMSWNRRV